MRISVLPVIETAREAPNSSPGAWSLTVDNSVMGPKFHRGTCVLVHRFSYTFGRTLISIRPAIQTARETPIQNRHFDTVGTRSHSEISGPTPKFLFGSVVAGCRCDRIQTPLRSNGHNFLLVAPPSITRIAGGADTRSRPLTEIGSRVQLGSRSSPLVVDMGARTSPI
ncbi:hypothetical protein Taro_024732 [Colocasia esculenta]|uniref:Uncharacterized protein n=1 Tax=Colocasia esculenta TaxID=4460 RepID=A0A843VFE2_COLES|nr:hypothetical protein [Colocasia esculenta]